jgi:hypothetical protein
LVSVTAGITATFLAILSVMPFSDGENVVFSMYYGPVPAGIGHLTVSIDTVDGEPLYHVSSVMRTNRFFSFFYRIDDRIDSYFTPDSFVSLRFAKSIREGEYQEDSSCDFMHEESIAVYSDGDTVELVPNARDYLTSLYYMRSLDLHDLEEISFVNHTSKKNYELAVKVVGEETIRNSLGTFDCVVVELVSESGGMFSNQGALRVWVTDDARRIPIQMSTRIAIGSIRAVLRGLELGN